MQNDKPLKLPAISYFESNVFFVQRNHDRVARYEALKKSYLTQVQ